MCHVCARLPAEEREVIEQTDELWDYVSQSNISMKNIARLKELKESGDSRIAELAEVLLDVAEVHPRKKQRLKFLARERRDLLRRLRETGLIPEDEDWMKEPHREGCVGEDWPH